MKDIRSGGSKEQSVGNNEKSEQLEAVSNSNTGECVKLRIQ